MRIIAFIEEEDVIRKILETWSSGRSLSRGPRRPFPNK
jgi:hypothetical protein